mgnify:FL=1
MAKQLSIATMHRSVHSIPPFTGTAPPDRQVPAPQGGQGNGAAGDQSDDSRCFFGRARPDNSIGQMTETGGIIGIYNQIFPRAVSTFSLPTMACSSLTLEAFSMTTPPRSRGRLAGRILKFYIADTPGIHPFQGGQFLCRRHRCYGNLLLFDIPPCIGPHFFEAGIGMDAL